MGVLWSMLNPLLTMCVQYMVFVNLFKWDIENYAVYLLIGTVTFNTIFAQYDWDDLTFTFKVRATNYELE